jgi:hypothetical protein
VGHGRVRVRSNPSASLLSSTRLTGKRDGLLFGWQGRGLRVLGHMSSVAACSCDLPIRRLEENRAHMVDAGVLRHVARVMHENFEAVLYRDQGYEPTEGSMAGDAAADDTSSSEVRAPASRLHLHLTRDRGRRTGCVK